MPKPLCIALALLVLATAGCSKRGPSDAEVLAGSRKILESSCLKSGAKLTTITAEQLPRLCTCTTDKVIAILGVDGLRGLATRGQPTEDVQQKLREAGVACAQAL